MQVLVLLYPTLIPVHVLEVGYYVIPFYASPSTVISYLNPGSSARSGILGNVIPFYASPSTVISYLNPGLSAKSGILCIVIPFYASPSTVISYLNPGSLARRGILCNPFLCKS